MIRHFSILVTGIFLILNLQTMYAQNYQLLSPDGTISINLAVEDNISYSITVDGERVLNPSVIFMTIDPKTVLGKNAKVVDVENSSVDEMLYPQLQVKSSEIRNQYNEIKFLFKGDYSLVFRAFNNGVAYQFETDFNRDITVHSEVAQFNFPKGAKVYFPREKAFFSHNECLYEYNALDTLSEADLCSLPALIEASSKIKLLITESALFNYPGMWLTGDAGSSMKATFPPYALEEQGDNSRFPDDRSIRISKSADYIAKTDGKRAFPWRIICVSKNDADLITNQLSYQLAKPTKIEDASWIKPGKVAWDWWNFNNIYGVDFSAGVNTETYKYYIDFASNYGLEYIILDEGWYTLGDVMSVVPEIDIEEIINYGLSKNIGVILWVTWRSLDQKLIEALDTYKSWGVKGLKIDFMQRDDQWMVEYYERIAKACAERKLLVDFHGSYKPSGLRRTYPNVMTREGVKGAENNKWANYITPEHNLTLPFIRMVAGPMDYTPGAMVNAQPENFSISWNRPMSIGTRAHQVAMYTLFESPLQMLCDSPSNYYKEKETTEFIAQIPTVWDETQVLHAKIGEYLAVAKRRGDKWFVGVMNNQEERTLDIDFSFLDEGTYTVQIFADGKNANRYASDYKRELVSVKSGEVYKIVLAQGGGWSAIITKK